MADMNNMSKCSICNQWSTGKHFGNTRLNCILLNPQPEVQLLVHQTPITPSIQLPSQIRTAGPSYSTISHRKAAHHDTGTHKVGIVPQTIDIDTETPNSYEEFHHHMWSLFSDKILARISDHSEEKTQHRSNQNFTIQIKELETAWDHSHEGSEGFSQLIPTGQCPQPSSQPINYSEDRWMDSS
ncbi:hypothetical protein MJO29_007577 [Puccinia striiformis f. sp. tritici]|nr:hypothetical protein MJO29_007577 [Puccinia striiformis f. sp. tritici]